MQISQNTFINFSLLNFTNLNAGCANQKCGQVLHFFGLYFLSVLHAVAATAKVRTRSSMYKTVFLFITVNP